MVMYFFAIRHWVNDVNQRASCASIELGNRKTVDLGNVKSVNCLMNKKAMRIKKITFKYHSKLDMVLSEQPIRKDETLAETIALSRIRGETLEEAVRRRGFLSASKSELESELNSPNLVPESFKDFHDKQTYFESDFMPDLTETEQGEETQDFSGITSAQQNKVRRTDIIMRRNTVGSECSEITYSSCGGGYSSECTNTSYDDNEKENRRQKKLKSCLKVKTLQESLQSSATPVHPCLLESAPCTDVPPSAPKRRVSSSTIGSIPPTSNKNDYKYVFGESSHESSFIHTLLWGRVEIREYSQCLGDNPACSDGPPIQLDWGYRFLGHVSITAFERRRAPYRRQGSLKINRLKRECMLRNIGYSSQDIAKAVRTKLRDQRRRIETAAHFTKHVHHIPILQGTKGWMGNRWRSMSV